MSARADFALAMREGAKAGRDTVVVYVAVAGDAERMAGFAVSRAVGGAVVRNRVKRRLRAISAPLLAHAPSGTRLVVRALPASASARFDRLAQDVAGATRSALSRLVAP